MTGAAIVDALRGAGLTLRADAGKVRVRGNLTALSADLRAAVSRYRPEVLAELTREQDEIVDDGTGEGSLVTVEATPAETRLDISQSGLSADPYGVALLPGVNPDLL